MTLIDHMIGLDSDRIGAKGAIHQIIIAWRITRFRIEISYFTDGRTM